MKLFTIASARIRMVVLGSCCAAVSTTSVQAEVYSQIASPFAPVTFGGGTFGLSQNDFPARSPFNPTFSTAYDDFSFTGSELLVELDQLEDATREVRILLNLDPARHRVKKIQQRIAELKARQVEWCG